MKRLVLTAVTLLFHLLSSPQSCQPVNSRLADAVKGLPGTGIRIYNNYLSKGLSNLALEWELSLNGILVQKGKVALLTIPPQHSAVIRLPVRMPASPGEVLLTLYYRLKKPEQTAAAGDLVAAEQLLLREYKSDLSVNPAGDLNYTDEGGSFIISSAATNLNMQFNKQTGWLQHYALGDHTLLDDTLRSDCWQGINSNDLKLQLFSTSTSTDMVVVKTDYVLSETPWLLHLRYTINAKGEMQTEQTLEQDTTLAHDTTSSRPTLPAPPLFGMKWILPAGFDSVLYDSPAESKRLSDSCTFNYTGLGRQALADAGVRSDIRWYKLIDKQGHGLLISADNSLLTVTLRQNQLNIDLPYLNQKKQSYHYIYKVTPQ